MSKLSIIYTDSEIVRGRRKVPQCPLILSFSVAFFDFKYLKVMALTSKSTKVVPLEQKVMNDVCRPDGNTYLKN